MSEQSELLLNELVAACVAFGRQIEPDWQTRIGKSQDALKAYITKLESENERLQNAWFVDETICPDGSLRPRVSALLERIAELEYNAANDAVSMHALLNILDINGTREETDDMYKTAHNLAYELRYRVAELEEAQRWRVVDDYEYPELDQDVLAIVDDAATVGHFYADWDGKIFFSADGGAMLEATHWMPIPDL